MGFGVPLHPAFAPYFSNITGFVHGPLTMHNLTTYAIAANESSSSPSPPPIDNPKAEIPLSEPPQTPSWAHLTAPFLGAYNSTDATERIGSWNWSRPAELALRVLEKRPRLPLRLGKVREVPFRMSLHLLVRRAVIPDQQRESRALGRPDL